MFSAVIFSPVVILPFFIHTPFHQLIFVIGISICGWGGFYASNLIGERDRLNREVFMQSYELKKAKEALDSCLAIDSQTHVYNERLLCSRLTEECDRSRRYRRPLSFLLAGIDGFSDVKKEYGEITSEVLAQEMNQFLKESMRGVDIIIRKGDDQLVAILPETAVNSARVVAERIRYSIEKKIFRIEGREIKITVSIGLVGFDSAIHRRKEDVLSSLDRALEKARKSGKNQITTIASETE